MNRPGLQRDAARKMPLAATKQVRWRWRQLREYLAGPGRRIYAETLNIKAALASSPPPLTRVEAFLGPDRQWLWLPGPPQAAARVIRAARKSRYGKINRIGGSIIHGCLAASLLPAQAPGRPRRSLFIGYGQDTYDAQLLANLGETLEAEFLDVLECDPADPRWTVLSRAPGIRSARYRQLDARQIGKALAGRQYDLVSIGRGSVDLMPPDDFQTVVGACHELLASNGLLLVPVSTVLLLSENAAAVERSAPGPAARLNQPQYTSNLGAFHLTLHDFYKYLDIRLGDDSQGAQRVLFEHLEAFAQTEPAAREWADLAAGASLAERLRQIATFGGRHEQVVALADLPGQTQAAAFDIYEKPRDMSGRWAFIARTTITLRPARACDAQANSIPQVSAA